MWAFKLLQIEPTTDQRQIKRAYAALLKITRPDDDPEGFQRLNEAYQAALEWEEVPTVRRLDNDQDNGALKTQISEIVDEGETIHYSLNYEVIDQVDPTFLRQLIEEGSDAKEVTPHYEINANPVDPDIFDTAQDLTPHLSDENNQRRESFSLDSLEREGEALATTKMQATFNFEGFYHELKEVIDQNDIALLRATLQSNQYFWNPTLKLSVGETLIQEWQARPIGINREQLETLYEFFGLNDIKHSDNFDIELHLELEKKLLSLWQLRVLDSQLTQRLEHRYSFFNNVMTMFPPWRTHHWLKQIKQIRSVDYLPETIDRKQFYFWFMLSERKYKSTQGLWYLLFWLFSLMLIPIVGALILIAFDVTIDTSLSGKSLSPFDALLQFGLSIFRIGMGVSIGFIVVSALRLWGQHNYWEIENRFFRFLSLAIIPLLIILSIYSELYWGLLGIIIVLRIHHKYTIIKPEEGLSWIWGLVIIAIMVILMAGAIYLHDNAPIEIKQFYYLGFLVFLWLLDLFYDRSQAQTIEEKEALYASYAPNL